MLLLINIEHQYLAIQARDAVKLPGAVILLSRFYPNATAEATIWKSRRIELPENWQKSRAIAASNWHAGWFDIRGRANFSR